MDHRRRYAILALIAGAALATSRPCGAAEGDGASPSIVQDERLAEVKAELEALFARVEEASLPAQLFEAKVREGLVKKVAPEKILSALEGLESRCIKASALLVKAGLKPAARSIELAAKLMAAGVTDKEIEKLLVGIASKKLDDDYAGKALLMALMMAEKESTKASAVGDVLAIVHKQGAQGIDAWLEKNSVSGKPSQNAKSSKKTKPSGKGKAKGKPVKPHAK